MGTHCPSGYTLLSLLFRLRCPWRSQNGACDLEGHTPWWAFSALIDKSEFSVASRRRDSRSWSPLIPGGRRNVRNCRRTDTLCLGWCLGTRGARPSLIARGSPQPGISLGPYPCQVSRHWQPLLKGHCQTAVEQTIASVTSHGLIFCPPQRTQTQPSPGGLLEAYMLLLGS